MKLIGLTGKARSGKDTVAAHLFHNHGFTRIAFADPLKMAAQYIFGMTNDQTWRDDLKETVLPYWGRSPRQIFQLLGTECVKGTFGPEVWVKRWFLSYQVLRETDDVVVPDIRFDVEADLIRKLGGQVIEIRRGPGLVGSTGDHISERGLSTLPDLVIDNNGTLEDLFKRIDVAVAA